MTKADEYLRSVYKKLKIDEKLPLEKYKRIGDIISELNGRRGKVKFQHATTGAITERLCRLALDGVKEENKDFHYGRFEPSWKWLGDIRIKGVPYDLTISVKSFKAKERFLASGTGSLLTPIVGWGLFDDPSEWKRERVMSYLYRGFVAIYLPKGLRSEIEEESLKLTNINNRKLLRSLEQFPEDIKTWLNASGAVDIKRI